MALMVKNPPASAGDARDLGSIPSSGRSPGAGNDNPLQYSCLENSMTSLAGYSPWGCKESDKTEHTRAHTRAVIRALDLEKLSLRQESDFLKVYLRIFSRNR